MSSEPAAAEGRRPAQHSGEPIEALASAVRALHHQERRGDLASLRRMDAGRALEPAFHRILAVIAPEASLERARRMALLVKILALSTDLDTLAPGRIGLGDAMAAGGISEKRVQTLMTARGEVLDDSLVRIARRLVRTGPLPYRDIGRLILGSAETIERMRFEIARAYWVEASRKAAAAPEQTAGETE